MAASPCGRVGEWLKPADCKSAAPCGLRRFESSPVHHSHAASVRPWAGGQNNPELSGPSVEENKTTTRVPRIKAEGDERIRETQYTGFGLGSSVGRARPW